MSTNTDFSPVYSDRWQSTGTNECPVDRFRFSVEDKPGFVVEINSSMAAKVKAKFVVGVTSRRCEEHFRYATFPYPLNFSYPSVNATSSGFKGELSSY